MTVFLQGLIADGFLNCSFIGGEDEKEGGNENEEGDGDSEDKEDDMEKSQRKIITLNPQICKYSKKFCYTMDEDTNYYASSLKDFVEVISKKEQ
ncbi:hypothetical protein H2248_008136 [Termitomyces sp. 'cryptogamus']|nr:hypothetical protein H2248_008136 [Termitomyces sp. 'cryptogamus']